MSIQLFDMLHQDLRNAWYKSSSATWEASQKESKDLLKAAINKATKTKLTEALIKGVTQQGAYKFFGVPTADKLHEAKNEKAVAAYRVLETQLAEKKRAFLLGQVDDNLQEFARELIAKIKEL